MKKLATIFMSALLAMTALSFTSCSGDDDNSDSGREAFSINGETYYNLSYGGSWLSTFDTNEYDASCYNFWI